MGWQDWYCQLHGDCAWLYPSLNSTQCIYFTFFSEMKLFLVVFCRSLHNPCNTECINFHIMEVSFNTV